MGDSPKKISLVKYFILLTQMILMLLTFSLGKQDMVPAIQWRRRLAPMVKGRDLGEGGFVLKICWFGIFSMATSESQYSSSWNHGWRKWVSLKKLVFV